MALIDTNSADDFKFFDPEQFSDVSYLDLRRKLANRFLRLWQQEDKLLQRQSITLQLQQRQTTYHGLAFLSLWKISAECWLEVKTPSSQKVCST